jgi:transposase
MRRAAPDASVAGSGGTTLVIAGLMVTSGRPSAQRPGAGRPSRLLKNSLGESRRLVILSASEEGGSMRGEDRRSGELFSYVSCEARVPQDHPLRRIRAIVDEALEVLSVDFERLYARTGRPSIAPEKLLRALLLQAFYTVRSERQLMEQLDYNLLFRWFVGLGMDAAVWDASVFSKNRDRLLEGDVAQKFLASVLSQPRVKGLLSNEHFSIDGTLIEAWAGHKSFKPKDGPDDGPDDGADDGGGSGGRNADRDFRGERRRNETHASTTDPEARLYRKGRGQPAELCHMGHLLMENRHGLIVGATLTCATGTAEREAALHLLDAQGGRSRRTAGMDKAYDVASFVAALRARRVTPHLARNDTARRSAIDRRTTRHPGYAVSQRLRKRIEEPFGWIKTIAGLRQTRHRGTARVGWMFTLAAAAYNLVRLPKLVGAAA